MAKTEVAVKETNAIALAGDFEQDAQSGFENMNQDDFALPFLKLFRRNYNGSMGQYR